MRVDTVDGLLAGHEAGKVVADESAQLGSSLGQLLRKALDACLEARPGGGDVDEADVCVGIEVLACWQQR